MKLSTFQNASSLIKLFYLGQPGEGKSGSLAPLAVAGEIKGCQAPGPGLELLVLDFDNKFGEIATAVLQNLVATSKITEAQRDEALARIDVCPLRENTGIVQVTTSTRKTIQKIGVKGTATAWKDAVKQLERWLPSLTPNHVLIVDSLTHAARAITNFSQELNGALNQELSWQQFLGPQQIVASLMTVLADAKSHAVVCAHWQAQELYKKNPESTDPKTGEPVEELIDVITVPISIGKAGSIELPSQFAHCLAVASEGSGAAARRYIHTRPTRGIRTKTPFFQAKPKYDISAGLVEYWALRTPAR
jgi:hypothetical protein